MLFLQCPKDTLNLLSEEKLSLQKALIMTYFGSSTPRKSPYKREKLSKSMTNKQSRDHIGLVMRLSEDLVESVTTGLFQAWPP